MSRQVLDMLKATERVMEEELVRCEKQVAEANENARHAQARYEGCLKRLEEYRAVLAHVEKMP